LVDERQSGRQCVAAGTRDADTWPHEGPR
jgi:hypothetical protein